MSCLRCHRRRVCVASRTRSLERARNVTDVAAAYGPTGARPSSSSVSQRVIVQRVVMPASGAVSWTVLGDDGWPVAAVESYLAYLAALERSPNTQRAYATSLKLWFEFLDRAEIAWNEVGLENVARFVTWLRAPA